MDMIKFAKLISYITSLTGHTGPMLEHEIELIAGFIKEMNNQTIISNAKFDMSDMFLAIKDKRKIEAIKLYRKMTGAGLMESKAAIESLIP